MKNAPQKLYIKTYGCQMNVYDSEQMEKLMRPLGYSMVDAPEGADMVVLNTCHIREKAAEKMYSELGRLRAEKKSQAGDGKKMIVAVAGCVGQAEGEEIFRRAPYVDIVVGPQSYTTLPDLVARVKRDSGHQINLDFQEHAKFDTLLERSRDGVTEGEQPASAFVSVQEGCDKFCTFCVVPYTRGAEFSRPVADITREVMTLASRGVREVTLLGQNVNGYHGTDPEGKVWSLGQLLLRLVEVPGIERVRYTTSHPRDMHDALYEAHAHPKVMPFLHLPIQAGSNRILAAMNRKHTREHYLSVIERLRKARPDIALSSDFIVGFPGETEEDFQATLDIVREVGYAQCYSFKYSPRPGTPAAEMENQVPEEVKSERLQRLQTLLNEQQTAFNKASIGQTMPVLFDRQGRHDGQLAGRSPYMQAVYIAGDQPELHGQLVPVLIEKAHHRSLTGKVVEQDTVLPSREKVSL